MLLLIKYTLLYGIVLMLVALGGMFSEHSGIINIALEGIMVIGGVAGVLTLTMLPADMSPFLVVLISVLVAALAGMVYSLLLAFASINLKAELATLQEQLSAYENAGGRAQKFLKLTERHAAFRQLQKLLRPSSRVLISG